MSPGQKQLSGLAGRIAKGGFVNLPPLVIQVEDLLGFDQREPQTVAYLHDAYGEQIAWARFFARRVDEAFEYSVRPALAAGEFE